MHWFFKLTLYFAGLVVLLVGVCWLLLRRNEGVAEIDLEEVETLCRIQRSTKVIEE